MEKLLISISCKYSYFKPIFIYIRKRLSKKDYNPSKLSHLNVFSPNPPSPSTLNVSVKV
jgi:hypothetical protein